MSSRQQDRGAEPLLASPPVAGGVRLTRVDDRAALERTLLALLPRIRRWLHHLLGPRGALDDATQDALLELSRALPRFEGRASLETFAHRITVRVAYRYFARRAPILTPDADDQASPLVAPDAALIDRQALEKLYRCLERLPKKRRAAFVLCAIEGLSPQEAADLEGISPGAMRSRYMHARDELARMLGLPQGGSR